ncbi:hypothetical protein ABK040_016146 [Willaertia magna]
MALGDENSGTTVAVQVPMETKSETKVDMNNNNRKNVFRRKKKNNKKNKYKVTEEVIKDPHDPNINLFHHLHILKIFGLNWILVMIGAMAYGLIPIICQYILGDLIDAFFLNAATATSDELKVAVADTAKKFTIITFCGMAAFGMQHFFLQLSNARLGTSLRKAYMTALTKQEMSFFDIKKIGSLTVVLSEDIPKIQDVYTNELYVFCQEIIQFIVGFILAMTVNWRMALILVSTTPLTFCNYMICSTISTIITKAINKLTDHSAAVANEITSCMRTIKSMAGEEKEIERFKLDLYKINKNGIFKGMAHGFAYGFAAMVTWGTVALGFWYGGNEVAMMETTLGSIFKVFGMLFLGVVAITRAATFFPHYGKAFVSETTFLKVYMRKPMIPFKGGVQPEQVLGNIVVDNVTFSYPSRPNTIVMKDFSLEIKQGQAVALVGPSGSGKSTIVGLLERFYAPVSGKIYLDGVDIETIDPMWLHRNIGIVSQEPVLFACTIRENIAYAVGMENTTQEQIENAAKQANAHNFICDLPDGYNTMLGEKGVSLSGGQKQRIAIARALLQNPKILLLDEATSALDTESEALVQAALDELMKGRTTICIAHRLTTVINSDMICVLVKGVMKEKGRHQELIKIPNGIYRKLAEKQMVLVEETVEDVEDVMDVLVDNENEQHLENVKEE